MSQIPPWTTKIKSWESKLLPKKLDKNLSVLLWIWQIYQYSFVLHYWISMTLVANSVTKNNLPYFLYKNNYINMVSATKSTKLFPRVKSQIHENVFLQNLKNKKSKTPEIYHKNFVPHGMWELVQFGILCDLGKKIVTHP